MINVNIMGLMRLKTNIGYRIAKVRIIYISLSMMRPLWVRADRLILFWRVLIKRVIIIYEIRHAKLRISGIYDADFRRF